MWEWFRLQQFVSWAGAGIVAAAFFVGPVTASEPTMVDASTVTFTEPDGDLVTVTFSRPILTSETVADEVVILEGSPGEGYVLRGIKLSELGLRFRNLDIKITVASEGEGDGQADVGFIDARGMDMRDVEVPGNLGAILVGDANARTQSLRTLQVASLGYTGDLADLSGEGEEVPYEELVSLFYGTVARLAVTGDIRGARVEVYGSPRATLGTVEVGGDLVGGTEELTGTIRAQGNIARVFIDGSLVGGAGDYSGSILSSGRILLISVNGSAFGGAGENSGRIQAIGPVASAIVLGSIVGGSGDGSGFLSGRQLGRVLVWGSLIGGAGDYSGRIESLGDLREFAVAEFVVGGGGEYSGSIAAARNMVRGAVGMDIEGGEGDRSGAIFAQRINQLLVGGSLVGGNGEGSGYVEAEQLLVRATVGGDLLGAAGIRSGSIFSQRNPRRVDIEGESIPGAGAQSGRVIVPPRPTANSSGGSYGSYGATFSVVGAVSTVDYTAVANIFNLALPEGTDLSQFHNWGNSISPGFNFGSLVYLSSNLSSPLMNSVTISGSGGVMTLPEGFTIGETGQLTIGEGVVATLADGTPIPPGVYTAENFPPQ